MMQLTGQKRFTDSLSSGYKMMNGNRVRKLLFKNGRSHQRKLASQQKLAVNKRIEDGDGE